MFPAHTVEGLWLHRVSVWSRTCEHVLEAINLHREMLASLFSGDPAAFVRTVVPAVVIPMVIIPLVVVAIVLVSMYGVSLHVAVCDKEAA